MTEVLTIPWHIQRSYIVAHRELTFLFSTNVFKMSYLGQAFFAQGEPNAFGIPVRFRFCKSDNSSYFSDSIFESMTKQIIDEAFADVPRTQPIIPFHGIGNGQSELKTRAPRTYAYIHAQILLMQYPQIEWNYRA